MVTQANEQPHPRRAASMSTRRSPRLVDPSLDAIRAEFADLRTHLNDGLDRIEKAIAHGRMQQRETRLRVTLRVTGWFAGTVIIVMGATAGGLYVVARSLLPKLNKLASLAQDAAPLAG